MNPILYICKSLVDVEVIYNLSSFSNCGHLNLLIYDWSNMAHISYTCFSYTCNIISVARLFYIFWYVLPKKPISNQYFTIHISCIKKIPRKLVISFNCAALLLIFEVYSYVSLQEYHCFWQITILIHWGVVLHEGAFLFIRVIHWLVFQKNIFVMCLWKNGCIHPRKILLQHETLFFITINSIIHCTYWTRKYCLWWLYWRCAYFSHVIFPINVG